MIMGSKNFFEESREQSIIKAEIVEKYFDAWAGIITATQDLTGQGKKIGYVDLFAGPGRYKDGSISTPLRVLNKAIEKESYAHRLVTIFNDKDEQNVRDLEKAIRSLPNIETLKYQPEIWNEEVGDKIAAQFERVNKIPMLAFIDPWSYNSRSGEKGLARVGKGIPDLEAGWGLYREGFRSREIIEANSRTTFFRQSLA
jgi:three-Cys-motif partner protein